MKIVFNESKKMQIHNLRTEIAILNTRIAMLEILKCKEDGNCKVKDS